MGPSDPPSDPLHVHRAVEPGDPQPERQIWPEGDRLPRPASSFQAAEDAGRRQPGGGADQQHRGQPLPADPGARRGEQLDVAEPVGHTRLFSDGPVRPDPV